MAEETWTRTRVMWLDNQLRIIAASGNKELRCPVGLEQDGQSRGFYLKEARESSCFRKPSGIKNMMGLDGMWSSPDGPEVCGLDE